MRITVIGTGYVGLVAGACFADTGNTVVCVDQDQKKIQMLRQGAIPIFEPGLETLVKRGLSNGRLSFTTSTAQGVAGCEILFLAVGTPALPCGEPDLQYLKIAAQEVGKCLTGYCVIVNKSTVPIAAHQYTGQWIGQFTQFPFDVVSNPEFLKEGTAVDDFLKPDRVVIGTDRKEVYLKMVALYSPFMKQGNPILWMDPISAEITKYACNSFLATRISFMNELALLCDQVGGDIEQVRKGMTTDGRIGKHFLYAGVGYGGSCFPKDVQALLYKAKEKNITLGVVAAAEAANQRQKKYLIQLARSFYSEGLSGKTFSLWGLAFKPNTDDMREAPSLSIIEELLEAGAKIRVYDPVAMDNAKKILEDRVVFCSSSYEVLEGADALMIATEWNEFRHPDFSRMKLLMKTPVMFDGRNLFDPEQMRENGFIYRGIGRGRFSSYESKDI